MIIIFDYSEAQYLSNPCQICLRNSTATNTVKDTPQLSDLKGPGTSKLDWRYFEYNKIDRNELQVRIYLHKGTGTKMTDKLTNLTEKK